MRERLGSLGEIRVLIVEQKWHQRVTRTAKIFRARKYQRTDFDHPVLGVLHKIAGVKYQFITENKKQECPSSLVVCIGFYIITNEQFTYLSAPCLCNDSRLYSLDLQFSSLR